jgi:hypothetical protein
VAAVPPDKKRNRYPVLEDARLDFAAVFAGALLQFPLKNFKRVKRKGVFNLAFCSDFFLGGAYGVTPSVRYHQPRQDAEG